MGMNLKINFLWPNWLETLQRQILSLDGSYLNKATQGNQKIMLPPLNFQTAKPSVKKSTCIELDLNNNMHL